MKDVVKAVKKHVGRLRVGDYVKVTGFQPEYEDMFGKAYRVDSLAGGLVRVGGILIIPENVQKITDRSVLSKLRAEVKDKKTLYKYLKRKLGTRSPGVATFGIRYKYEEDLICIANVCHAAFRWGYGEEIKDGEEMVEVCMWVKGYRDEQPDDDYKLVYDKYLHWVMNDSPWAEAFLTKDIDIAYEKGCSMDVSKNISVIMGAIIAAREGWEFKSRLPMFKRLMDEGFDLKVCYVVSAYLYSTEIQAWRYAAFSLTSSHMVLNCAMSWEKVRRFFREGYDKNLKGIGKDTSQCSYRVFSTVVRSEHDQWGLGFREENEKERLSSVFNKVIDAKKVGEGFRTTTVIDEECFNRFVSFIAKELK